MSKPTLHQKGDVQGKEVSGLEKVVVSPPSEAIEEQVTEQTRQNGDNLLEADDKDLVLRLKTPEGIKLFVCCRKVVLEEDSEKLKKAIRKNLDDIRKTGENTGVFIYFTPVDHLVSGMVTELENILREYSELTVNIVVRGNSNPHRVLSISSALKERILEL